MPIIFQNFQHLFLELFCAEAALKVRYFLQVAYVPQYMEHAIKMR